MKTRNDFVSNSSSCSFVIQNPGEIKFDNNLVMIFANANYLHFIDVSFWNMHKVKGVKSVKSFDKFKNDVIKVFGAKANVSFEHRDCDSVPPEEVYVEIDTDNFWKNYNAKKQNMLEKLIANSYAIHMNFGEDCEGGIERATQAATLLDYAYDADIESDDSHFDYSPVENLITKDDE